MKLTGGVTFLPCTDLERTTGFYRDMLELKVAQRQSDRVCIFDTGYGYWGFCQYADGRPPLSGPKGVCLSLNLENREAVLAAYQRVKDRCQIHRGPEKHPDFPVFSFFALDPDGYLVEFQRVEE